MSINLKLGFGMAQVYGFTSIYPQGVYFPRNLVFLPPRQYCIYALRKFREEQQNAGIKGGHASGSGADGSSPA
jgi:hypothetical protein